MKRARAAARLDRGAPAPGALSASARAHTNIALAKYWGKADTRLNLPAVPSISMTLDGLYTDTTVTFSRAFTRDALWFGTEAKTGKELERVSELLARVRRLAGTKLHAAVQTENNFPTASGLASSASGFAALAAAATAALGLPLRPAEVSALARASSASAARSVFGGFVELPAGKPGDAALAAKPLFPPTHGDFVMVIAVTSEGAKATGSTDGMERSRRTSPLYAAWLERAPALAREVKRALRENDLARLGLAMEQSTFAFHACALTALPATMYFLPATVAAYHTVRRLRDEQGLDVYATMDAGPHVKALTRAAHAARVARALAKTPGVLRTMVVRPGPDLFVARAPSLPRRAPVHRGPRAR